MNLAYPLQFDALGRTAQALDEEHVRDLIEQVLFVTPGERLMRPEFGSNLAQLVFAPNSVELAGATQMLVQGALQRWLGEVLAVESVTVDGSEETLSVTVEYRLLSGDETTVATFVMPG